MNLTIRDVEVQGRSGLDVVIMGGRIAAIGEDLKTVGIEFEGRGGALIPGLVDHHIHLFGLAARASSVELEGAATFSEVRARIKAGLRGRSRGGWLRVLGYHETMAGELTRTELDALAPHHRLRVQHQSGSLWILNSLAIASVGADAGPANIERDRHGRATGRVWRGDVWLRERIGAEPPPFAPISRQLAAYGVTALTDASVTTDAETAARLAEGRRTGNLMQRLTLMSGQFLEAPQDAAFTVGPVKILLDDHALPDFDDLTDRIARARQWGRAVAVHCVTAGELALTLAAFRTAGSQPGDRIEHAAVVSEEAISELRELNLTVVTQPAFIAERGDRYGAAFSPKDQRELFRCGSLIAAGVRVAGSSDAPYATPNPWVGVCAAMNRRTALGRILGEDEAVPAAAALSLYLDDPATPGSGLRHVAVGLAADLCLLKTSMCDVLRGPTSDLVRATFIGGQLVYDVGQIAGCPTPQ